MPSKSKSEASKSKPKSNSASHLPPEPEATPSLKPSSHASRRPSNNQSITIVGLVIILVLAAVYMLTGSDPLGFFTEPTPTLDLLTFTIQPTVVAQTPISPTDQGWWEVFFTNPMMVNDPNNLQGSIPEKLISYINDAKNTIHVAAFEFDLTPVAEALINAHNRGVEVQWVTDDEYGIEVDEDVGHGQFAMLKEAGIEVKDDSRTALMHNKFWIFDKKIVWTGSTNITINGNFRNNNNVIVIKSQALAEIYEMEFAEMWAGEFGPKSPSTLNQQSLSILGTPIQVLFASEDKVISHLIPLVENAQSNIRIMAFSFTYNELRDAVVEAFSRNVDVKAIFETRGSETNFSAMPLFFCAEIPTRQDGNPATFHHKVFIIDERIVITGSLNFSANANESNDENTIVITNPQIAALYIQEFDKRWAEAKEPDPTDISCK